MTSVRLESRPDAVSTAAGHRALPAPFDSARGEAAYMAAYEANMRFWPVPHEPLDVSSRFGRTHLVASGPTDAPPLVLLHGYAGSLTMWWPNVADLSRAYRVYAVDVVGQPGKSIPDQPITSRAEYVEWLTGVLDALNVERTHLAGMSYGGWLTLNYAVGAPERVKRIVLLSPAAGFVPLVEEFYRRGMALNSSVSRPATEDFMHWLAYQDTPREPGMRDRYDRLIDQFYLGLKHFCGAPREAVVPPVTYSDDELRSIRAPTLLLIGDCEVIYDPAAALDRAKRLLPNFEGALVPRSSHLMSYSQAPVVDARMLAFLKGD